ncbi:sigma-70 family RNA polymerase sigma factor [Nocardia asteroides]|uniref:sigma-70 family RNA polymerase sigma factor n=1 Tax=Nocardia asteroides TaxID=1824 RepID=UPI001E4AE48E|nr:sigma-70 family RNA polymerase sigma factor [Nocardia asteroides]UGT62413.1 sigma-70 family RNA polymerase sigma factor [Nocardia asteroides]
MRTAEKLFLAERPRLLALGCRMLGSAADAEDVVQEAWIRLCGAGAPDNPAAWLTTVTTRLCLDRLRARARRPEQLGAFTPEIAGGIDPVEETVLVEEVGRALLVLLDRLGPEERVAFVLHDLFAVPFAEIAPMVRRTPATAKRLASRARAKVRGAEAPEGAARDRVVAERFLAAARSGDIGALLTVLAPDVVRTADPAALPAGAQPVVRGADAVARETVLLRARARARYAAVLLIDGAPGLVVAPGGRLRAALRLTVRDGRIACYEVIADPPRLAPLTLALPGATPARRGGTADPERLPPASAPGP